MRLYIPLILVFGVSVYLLLIHGRIARKRRAAEAVLDNLEAEVRQRFALISRLIKPDKPAKGLGGYDEAAAAVLSKAREEYLYAYDIQAELNAEAAAGAVLDKIIAHAETGGEAPDAVSEDENFKKMRQDLKTSGENIASYKKAYDAAAGIYNESLKSFAGGLAVKIFLFQPKKLLQ
ncbi:MAG: LemA family protein [Defluviitaleaceae bacterium]|nr:LemA family protein [Defluviitaleaceae bacterium]